MTAPIEKPRDTPPAPKQEPVRARRRAARGEGVHARTAGPAVDASLAEPSGSGFVLQISALNERAPAELIAKRLSAKGYAAYVMAPAAGAPARMYRVRIGKFKTRREAESDRGQGRKRRADQALDYALALASGVLLALSFPKFGHPAFGWIALAPAARRRAAGTRAVAGAGRSVSA